MRTSRISGTASKLASGALGNNIIVSVGDNGTILTSSDAITWSSITPITSKRLSGIAYGNSTYVTVGNNGTFLSSNDASSWVSRTSGSTKHFRRVFF